MSIFRMRVSENVYIWDERVSKNVYIWNKRVIENVYIYLEIRHNTVTLT